MGIGSRPFMFLRQAVSSILSNLANGSGFEVVKGKVFHFELTFQLLSFSM
jgi:hypothetical protein